jgi:hypothetical protein
MSMPFTGLDMCDIPDIDLVLFVLVDTMPEPDVTISSWSQLCARHPWCHPDLKRIVGVATVHR